VVGPLIDSGHYLAAGYAARAVNTLLAACVVGAVAWAAAQAFPYRPQVWLAAALVTAVNSWNVRVGGSVYNDLLCSLWATILLGLTIRSVHRGVTLRKDILLALTAAAALATRASLIAVVACCFAVLVLQYGLTRRSWRSALIGTGRYTLVGLAALIPSAWFYLRNLQVTGSVLGGNTAWAQANHHVTTRSTLEALTDLQSWKLLTAVFSWGVFDRDLVMALLLWIPLALAAVAALQIRRRSALQAPLAAHLTFTLLAATALGVTLMQLQYTTGGSGLNPRYLMPVVFVTSLAVSYGLSQIPRFGVVLLALWTGLTVGEMILAVARSSTAKALSGTAPTFFAATWAAVAVCVVAVLTALACQWVVGQAAVIPLQRTDAIPAAAGHAPKEPR
jgi:hypothetical protein